MDDFNIINLSESKNEWSIRIVNILYPELIEGLKNIFDEAYNLAITSNNDDKYLMTFQNLLNNIPKWNDDIVKGETERIITSSGCSYLEDLLTCVHIIQLKSLTCARVGIKQKKIDIDIPNLYQFIHKTYINLARKVYINVYLFEKDITSLQIQKNNRELELITKEAILNSIRESIPIESLLKNYLDDTSETEVEIEEKREQIIDKELIEIQKNKELEKIKENMKKELEEEKKVSTNKLSEINKDINSDSTNINIVTTNNHDDDEDEDEDHDDEHRDNDDDDGNDSYDNDSIINIKNSSLDIDIDAVDLNKLNDDKDLFKNEIKLEPEIELDIEELK